jgi:hypothetical protein
MELVHVTANQAAILAQLGEPLQLLLAPADSPLGRRVSFLLERSWQRTSIYAYFLPPSPEDHELPFIRQLGITQLPELRCYQADRTVVRHVGVQAIATFAAGSSSR